jgi:hypothetical protein
MRWRFFRSDVGSGRFFRPTGDMTTPRGGPAAVLLPNGKVLIAGGAQDLSAEIYDPSTGTFTATGKMISGGGFLTLLQNGKVLVGSANAQIFDSTTGTFSLTAAYPDPNPGWGTMNLLLDGRVLFTGCAAACTVSATELYDPGTGTFSTTGPMKGWDNVKYGDVAHERPSSDCR